MLSITCHPTQVNVPRLNPSQAGGYPDLPTMEAWTAGERESPRFREIETSNHPSLFYSALQFATWTLLCYALSTAGTSTATGHESSTC